MTRPSEARIDLGALKHNYLLAKSIHGNKALAVIKANAYGHGAVECAKALEPIVDGFAVAFVAEARALRLADISAPILVLEGFFDTDDLATAESMKLWVVVHHEAQLSMIETRSSEVKLSIWLKADSGMGRVGFALKDIEAAHARLCACQNVADVTLMTHFACADEPDRNETLLQIQAFENHTKRMPGPRSLANSAGILGWYEARSDWARPGIMLYGADPMPEAKHQLKPVMTLCSEIFAVRTLQAGDALGYGGRFVARRPTRVGLVAVGYADGYPRSAPKRTPVLVGGKLTGLIGRVSMDMLTVDLTDLPDEGIGSPVELWGNNIDVNDIARRAGTIAYELLCNVKRVPLAYLR